MAIKKPTPKTPKVKEASPTLMGNQDTKRGDYRGSDKIPFSLVVPADLLQEARELAQEEGCSVARLFVEGLRWRVNRDK